MAFLSAVDLSIFHTREDGEEVVQSLPILTDPKYMFAVVNEFMPSKPKWACEDLHSLSMFGVSVCLASLRILPQNYQFQDCINKEDFLVDAAIESNVFTFIHNIILENVKLFKEPFLYKRMHNLLTDFVVYMYPKAKDLRMKANEVSRTLQVYLREGLEAPANLPRYFEYLLLCVGKFYAKNDIDPQYTVMWYSLMDVNPRNNLRVLPRSVALFKFLKLAADMLPSNLFVPFLKMLSGLSSNKTAARYCFNILKQSGSCFPKTISWDHFFLSLTQYYNNLRHETAPTTDTVYRMRPGYHKGVSPQELEGLHSVLLLIRTVAEHDSFCRLALWEHPVWTPIATMLGLVSCSVPIYLKADLLLTLAALSKSKETSLQMWEFLEASQILITVPTTSSYIPRGIQTELDERESRKEEYPLTRAVLNLLDTLVSHGIPKGLGAGPRKPGIYPYFSFIVNSVFLKYNSRSYQDGAEKWDVALLCLLLFEKFLKKYEPKVTDFPKRPREFKSTSPAGYNLMLQLNNKTETLNVILDILDEGTRYFDSYVHFAGQEKVAECTLAALNILSRALALQMKFFGTMAQAMCGLNVTGLSKLLLSINRKTGRPDHCINIAKYISYEQYFPKHAVAAVKVIGHVTGTATNHLQFLNILCSMEHEQNIIKNAFCQCLDSNNDDVEVINIAKKEIIRLLKQCLVYPPPNLTHFLLGFNLKHDISKTEFQYPGVLGVPRNCLHAVLSILDAVAAKNVETLPVVLAEMAYQLLYLLASNSKTSGPVLRFVRLNKQFFPSHLKRCENVAKSSKHLFELSWLLKTLAVELQVASTMKLINYLKQLTQFLGNVPIMDDNPKTMFLQEILRIDLSASQVALNVCKSPTKSPTAHKKLLVSNEKKQTDFHLALTEFINSWRLVVEVIVCFIPSEVLEPRDQEIFSLNMLFALLQKVASAYVSPEIARLFSGSCLLMMNNIKRNYLREKRSMNVLSYHIGTLKEILNLLVKWIIQCDVIDEELRINLYASLLTFVQLTSIEPRNIECIDQSSSLYVSRLDDLGNNVETPGRHLRLSTDILNNFGEKLMEVLCNNCIGGQEICKMLSMSCVSHILGLSDRINWILYLSGKGYLKHIILSIYESDKELRTMLDSNSGNIKALYLYFSKMVLVTKLAESKMGTELLLEQKILGAFSNMTVFQNHPEITRELCEENALDKFLPPPEQQYLEVFMPTLHFCNAVLTTLGTENQSAVTQILYFIFSHLDVIELILRSGTPDLSAKSLKELALLTSVISRIAGNDLIDILENPNMTQSNRAQMNRIQRLMLNLIPKFFLTEDSIKKLLSNNGDKNTFQTSERLLCAMQVAANVIWYAKNIVYNKDVEREVEVGIIFAPTLYDPKLNFQNSPIYGEDETSLGIIVQQLLYAVSYQHDGKITLELLKRKIREIPDMNSMELKEFLDDNMDIYHILVKREMALDLVSGYLITKKKEIDYCAFIIENALYLIWTHLDYFMFRAVPSIKTNSYIHPGQSFNRSDVNMSMSSDLGFPKVSIEVINNLKQGLVPVFNDSFSKQILEAAQDRSQVDREFVEVLLRKIKRLMQFVQTT